MYKVNYNAMKAAAEAGGTALYEAARGSRASRGLASDTRSIGRRVNTDIAESPEKILGDRVSKRFKDIQDLHLARADSASDEIDLTPPEAADQEHIKNIIPSYPKDLNKSAIEDIIRAEATKRKISADVAIKLFRAEGAGGYQSNIKSGSQKKVGGQEASYGPFQLYTGGGLGNEYEELTGRLLRYDNTLEGITKQIQFALDKAAEDGWSAWYGSKAAGIKPNEGLADATPIYNWKEQE